MNHKLPFRSLGALVVVFSLTGCAEWNYQDMSDPSRDVWQKPQGVVEKLSLARGARVADLGAGGRLLYLAPGQGGRRQEERSMRLISSKAAMDMIFKEMVARGTPNVRPVRAEPHDPRLPEPVDLVFSCDVYHRHERSSGLFSVPRLIATARRSRRDSRFSSSWILFRHVRSQNRERRGPTRDGSRRLSASERLRCRRPPALPDFREGGAVKSVTLGARLGHGGFDKLSLPTSPSFPTGIKLVSASRAPDAIRLHREFVGTNPHAATIRTPGEVNFLIIHRFVLHSV